MVSDFIAGVLFLVAAVAAILGLFLGWSEWRGTGQDSGFPAWRRTTARIALVIVTIQGVLFSCLWTPLTHHYWLLTNCVAMELLFAALAVPCIFIGKRRYQWWLLGSSLSFSVLSFFVTLAELAY